jgi:LemA protein
LGKVKSESHVGVLLIIILAAVVIPAFFVLTWIISTYNRLLALRNRCKSAFTQIDTQLRRRYDLIPNLVETAKAYIKNQRDTLEAVIVARNAASAANERAVQSHADAAAMKELSTAETALSSALSRLLAIAELYPELKANKTMLGLSEELSSLENKITFATQAFNDAVVTYNTAQKIFPANTLAGPLNFAPAEFSFREQPEQTGKNTLT